MGLNRAKQPNRIRGTWIEDPKRPIEAAQRHRPRVLVLLAAYNGAAWIGEQIESIIAQRTVDVHVVVRDDGSTDDTCVRVSQLMRKGSISLNVTAQPSRSAAQNFFALIRETPGDGFDFIAFADQDDVWDPHKLSRACDSLTLCSSAGYSSATRAVWPDGRVTILRQRGSITAGDYLFEGAGQGCTFVLRKTFYTQLREFVISHAPLTAPLHYHDWATYAIVRALGLEWTFDPLPWMEYRQHSGNDTGARRSLRGASKRIALIRNGWYKSQLGFIAELCSAAAPANPTIASWRGLLDTPDGWQRRVRMASFCIRRGRRRKSDALILVLSSLFGWI